MTTSIDLDEVCQKALVAVREVGDFVFASQHNISNITFKNVKNPQTNIDIEAENKLVSKLKTIIPDAGFLLEEGESQASDDLTWIIDPIDGTKFFSTDFPCFFTQIALQKGPKTVFSAIYNPVSKQMFHAVFGSGSYLNNKKMTLKYDGPVAEALVNVELGKIEKGVSMDFVNTLAPAFNRFWMVAGIFAPYLITNTIQAYIRFHSESNNLYDLAPRFLLVEEAGGVVHEHIYKGRKLYIAAHPKLVKQIEIILSLTT